MTFQVFHQAIITFTLPGTFFHIVVLGLHRQRIGKITTVKLNQKLGKVLTDKLLSAETFLFQKEEFFLVGLIHSSGKNALPLGNDFRKKTLLLIADSQTLLLKTPDSGTVTIKADDHDTGAALPIRLHRVKLIWRMKKNISFFQKMRLFSCLYRNLPGIHANEFPERMRLPRKIKVTSILKIM